MAKDTQINLRNKVMYSIYVRNHTAQGTFKAIISDLDRIKDLGVDIIWFMPIHPCGQAQKKGTMGSPYAISNYREVNPEYGSKNDFVELVDAIHERGMQCIIDIVYNHTSPDANLVSEHPDFYYRFPDGRFGNKLEVWNDVYDLDFNNRKLWDYHIESLKMWADLVDGFRCDVAPLIPLEFWLEAREELDAFKPGLIWLAETVDPPFIKLNRKLCLTGLSDGEVYQAFDVVYDYDAFHYMNDYLLKKGSLESYIRFLNHQDTMYPVNYIKLRYLENHDNLRIRSLLDKEEDLLSWTAFLYFQKGLTLIYAGQETQNTLKPSLFEIEKVNWDASKSIAPFIKKLSDIKKDGLFADGDYTLLKDGDTDTVLGFYEKGRKKIVGVFPLNSAKGKIHLPGVPCGNYLDEISGTNLILKDGFISLSGKSVIFKYMTKE